MTRRRYPTPRPARRHARTARLVGVLVGCLYLALAVLGVVGIARGWR